MGDKISQNRSNATLAFKAFSLLIILCVSCTVAEVNADEMLAVKEQLGRKIYREGSDGCQTEITASLGLADDSVSATAFACANCHGLEGEGKQEGGLTIPAITSQQLFADASSNQGAKRIYDGNTLIQAITKGINSQNKALSQTMPRYNLTTDQAQALLAYLKRLGSMSDAETGITDTEVQLATVLPLTGPLAAMGNLLKATLAACVAEVNGQGLIYGRKLTLATLDSGSSINETFAATKQLVSETKPFALVSGYFPEITPALYNTLSQEKIPVIAPLTFEPYDSSTPSAAFFYFLPSYADQSRALADYWLAHLTEDKSSAKPKLAIIHSGRTADLHLAEAVRRQLQRHHLDLMADVTMSQNPNNNLLTKLGTEKPDAIFIVGNANELTTLNRMLPNMDHPPVLLGLLAMLSADLINMTDLAMPKMLLASPFNLNAGMQEFADLLDRYSVKLQSPGLQRIACEAVNFVTEGLKRTGKHLTRSKFTASLEETKNFPVGIMPPFQFDPNNRMGARGAYIFSVDTETGSLSPPSSWITTHKDTH
jgi:ABC-type branched-subunit amino acid transport system substrate-binding protein